MKAYLDQLDAQLRTLAADPAMQPEPPKRRWWRRLLGGGATLLAIGGGVFALTTPSTAELPVLQSDATDAQILARRYTQWQSLHVDLSQAHVFGTPDGPGYAFVSTSGKRLCLVVPLVDEEVGYGSSCAPLATAERRGLGGQSIPDAGTNPGAKALAYFVLPEGAERVRVTEQGRAVAFQVDHGVIVRSFAHDGEISFTTERGTRVRFPVSGPFRTTAVLLDCGNGRTVTIPPPPVSGGPQAANDAIKRARHKFC